MRFRSVSVSQGGIHLSTAHTDKWFPLKTGDFKWEMWSDVLKMSTLTGHLLKPPYPSFAWETNQWVKEKEMKESIKAWKHTEEKRRADVKMTILQSVWGLSDLLVSKRSDWPRRWWRNESYSGNHGDASWVTRAVIGCNPSIKMD